MSAPLTPEQALAWQQYALRCERVLADLRGVAAEVAQHWDKGRDAKLGRMLFALDGEVRGYDARIDAFRDVLATRPALRREVAP